MHVPSMMSISPPSGQGPAWLSDQKAGQVAHPCGMCWRSRMATESVYARLDKIRMLSLPVPLTTLVLSARMTKESIDAVYPLGSDERIKSGIVVCAP